MKTQLAKRMLVFLVLLGALVSGSAASAQTPGSDDQDRRPSAQDVQSKTSPENKSSDETEQFKHSASVQLISRITGLSQEGAYWLAVALNFGIVLAIIVWAAKKNLPAVFRNRTATIQKSLEEARQASEEAKRRLSDIESRLGKLDQEIAGMRANVEKEAAAEEERIKAVAEEDGRRIVESAEQEIAAIAKAARRDLTAYAADLAVSLAAKQIHVDASTDESLLRRFAQQLSTNGAPEAKN
jgi:F-type H+-transporting ATPase subunit b